MKILYFGCNALGITTLQKLKSRHEIAGIITAPDRPSGRGLKLSCTPVKNWAQENHIKIYQPEMLSDTRFAARLEKQKPELIVLFSYGKKLPPQILKIPSIAALNLHPSLLPKYRGAAPLEWTLINGEKETGLTVIKMKSQLDAGHIIMQEKITISETDDIFALQKRVSEKSPDLMLKSIEKVKKGLPATPQRGKPTYARKLKKKDGLICWEKEAREIHNLIRGLKEWPGAYTYIKGKYLKIHLAEPEQQTKSICNNPGEIIGIDKKGSITAACGKGTLKILEVQMEGKKRMAVSEFLRGSGIKPGNRFSSSRGNEEK